MDWLGLCAPTRWAPTAVRGCSLPPVLVERRPQGRSGPRALDFLARFGLQSGHLRGLGPATLVRTLTPHCLTGRFREKLGWTPPGNRASPGPNLAGDEPDCAQECSSQSPVLSPSDPRTDPEAPGEEEEAWTGLRRHSPSHLPAERTGESPLRKPPLL